MRKEAVKVIGEMKGWGSQVGVYVTSDRAIPRAELKKLLAAADDVKTKGSLASIPAKTASTIGMPFHCLDCDLSPTTTPARSPPSACPTAIAPTHCARSSSNVST